MMTKDQSKTPKHLLEVCYNVCKQTKVFLPKSISYWFVWFLLVYGSGCTRFYPSWALVLIDYLFNFKIFNEINFIQSSFNILFVGQPLKMSLINIKHLLKHFFFKY